MIAKIVMINAKKIAIEKIKTEIIYLNDNNITLHVIVTNQKFNRKS